MNDLSNREIILGKIENALINKTAYRQPAIASGDVYFNDADENLALRFENEFSTLLGKFFRCSNAQQANIKLQELSNLRQWNSIFCSSAVLQQALHLETLSFTDRERIDSSEVAVTDCECLIARTGTIVLSSAQHSGSIIPIYAPIHIVIAYSDQLFFDISDAINMLKRKYTDGIPSMLSLATGPSRTGDIEKTLVVGVHGPREVYVFLIDEASDILTP